MKTKRYSLFLAAILALNPLSCLALSEASMVDAKPAPKWGVDLSGRWHIDEGDKQYEASLDADGNGSYTHECGQFATTEVAGRIWKGRWTQTGNDHEGGFSVELSKDGKTAEGRWWYTRVGDRRDIPPGSRGGAYHFKRLTSPTGASAPVVWTYPESQTRQMRELMDAIAAELNANARDAVAGVPAAAPALRNGGAFSACPVATPPSTGVPSPGNGPKKPVSDPLERWNRAVFKFNLFIDNYLMQPFIRRIYNPVVPAMVRRMIDNGFLNLNEPETIVADILQGKFVDAGKALVRVSVNSSLGLAGTFDVAHIYLGIDRNPATLEQAIASWGVPAGPYLILPFNKPSNLRDTAVWVAKTYFSPMSYVLGIFGRMGVEAVRQVNERSLTELGYNDPDKIYDAARQAAMRP